MMHSVYIIMLNFISCVCANGLLLLYRPKDITSECAFSRRLRYDISYGMGMSDTITLIFRTLNDIDYECIVEIVTTFNQYLLVVVRYPTTIALNCAVNKDAITVLKRWRCSRLCDLIERDVYSPYLIFSLKNRLRFLFKSNSSINSDINADFYQVTITSARVAPATGCNERNETICSIEERHFCFTTGVVCDGIKNCGVDDWFDERKSKCNLPVERLGYAPVVAVMAVLLCAFVAGGHMLMRCLPSPAQSFFIFNANEDNRLCIDPLLVPKEPAPDIDHFPRVSVIPVSLSSSENEEENSQVIKMHTLNREGGGSSKDKELMSESDAPSNSRMEIPESERKNTVRSMSEKLQDKLKFLTKYASMKHTYDKKAKTYDL